MKTKREQISLDESRRVDVDIFIGFGCNLRCNHCSVEFHKTQPDLTTNEVYAEIDRYQSLINGRLVISGGEPTYYVVVAGHPGWKYNWKSLYKQQKELGEMFGNYRAHPDPDYYDYGEDRSF